jgi:hypothetical protein
MRFLFVLVAMLIGGDAAAQPIALTPVATPSAANNLVLKATPGHLFGLTVANQTATAGFLVVLNATTAPADGAIVPLVCVALPANGNAQIPPGFPSFSFNVGMVAVLTSATTCFTKTTGVITGFISGLVD